MKKKETWLYFLFIEYYTYIFFAVNGPTHKKCIVAREKEN